jgi:hypothetical protein
MGHTFEGLKSQHYNQQRYYQIQMNYFYLYTFFIF